MYRAASLTVLSSEPSNTPYLNTLRVERRKKTRSDWERARPFSPTRTLNKLNSCQSNRAYRPAFPPFSQLFPSSETFCFLSFSSCSYSSAAPELPSPYENSFYSTISDLSERYQILGAEIYTVFIIAHMEMLLQANFKANHMKIEGIVGI